MHYHIGGIATPLLSVNLLVYDIIVAMSGSQAVNSNGRKELEILVRKVIISQVRLFGKHFGIKL